MRDSQTLESSRKKLHGLFKMENINNKKHPAVWKKNIQQGEETQRKNKEKEHFSTQDQL